DKLKRDADRALEAGTFSVMQKALLPPSGDTHDYMSVAPYWWPNPESPNGLPYVRRDGEINPEREKTSDRNSLGTMIQNVKTLGLAYFVTGRDIYATQAAKLLRVWFLDEATRMNPNLKYAQAIPGRNQGRAAGIIETHNLPELVDAVGLLGNSISWSATDQKALQKWFDTYLSWLLESPEGRIESRALNNHGSWYDVQIASFALFVDKKEAAKKILGEFATKRIASQIEPDGRQLYELERTQAWSYSLFNLEALFDAAMLGDKLGLDLWSYEAPNKRGIRKALDWLIPFATGEKRWSYKQISALQPDKLAPFLRRAAVHYREPAYEKVIGKLPVATPDQRWQLLHPASLRQLGG
ncbi:MAG TPA: alginate lyase family protein, partial [Methylomirabilota bacterium]|nr:alginate lyase family protein [Methylomirabilota bacterium]